MAEDNIRKSGKIIDPKNKLMGIDTREGWMNHGRDRFYFDKGDVRIALSEIFETGQLFTFFRTYANADAVEAFEAHVAVRKDSKTPYEVREKKKDDDPDEYPCTPNLCIPLRFDQNLLRKSHSCLGKRLKEEGIKPFVSFELVNSESTIVGCSDYERSLFWPRIYVVRGEDSADMFRKFSLNYADSKFYDLLMEEERKDEHYGLEAGLLKRLCLNPIHIDSREWQVDSKTLKDAVDFLAAFNFSCDQYQYHNHMED